MIFKARDNRYFLRSEVVWRSSENAGFGTWRVVKFGLGEVRQDLLSRSGFCWRLNGRVILWSSLSWTCHAFVGYFLAAAGEGDGG